MKPVVKAPASSVRLVAAYRRHVLRGQRDAIDRAPRDRRGGLADPALLEDVLAADIEREVARHAAAPLRDEARHAAEVVAVAVAEDQAVDPAGIDVEQIEVAVDDLGRVAEVDQVLRLVAGRVGLHVQRQPPLAGERRHLALGHLAHVLDLRELVRRFRAGSARRRNRPRRGRATCRRPGPRTAHAVSVSLS